MSARNVEELLDTIADYADQLDRSTQLADTGSLAVAKATATLFEQDEWVEEWNRVKPISIRPTGRPADPRGRNRFSQWLAWKEAQRNRKAPGGPYVYRLMNANNVVSSFAIGKRTPTTSEGTIRPLTWLTSHGYAERVDEVWQKAVELAGSEKAVTQLHVRQAVNEWKRTALSRKEVRKAISTPTAERDRGVAMAAIRKLWSDGVDEEVKAFDDWYKEFRKGKAAEMPVFEDDIDEVDVVAEEVEDGYGQGEGGCVSCGAHWFGFRIEHCVAGCHQTFSGSTTGDFHRTGPYEPPSARRCRMSDELKAFGLWAEVNQYGTEVWHGSPNKEGIPKRHPKFQEKQHG